MGAAYERVRHLPRLFAVYATDLAEDIGSRRRLIGRIEDALRRERKRGLAGHWAYDIARHYQMIAVWEHETKALAALTAPTARRAPDAEMLPVAA